MNGWALAIDFGTSNTTAAEVEDGRIRSIPLQESATSMPSAIVHTASGFRVGPSAVNAQLQYADGFEATPKRLVGHGDVLLHGEFVSPVRLVAEIHRAVRDAALRRQNGREPDEVWLTHPVAWAPSQVETLRAAAVEAGFRPERIRVVPEPVAAAAHYAATRTPEPGARIAVFDFGGGTLDVAVLERRPERPEGFVVLAYGGDPLLGGRTFDARLTEWVLDVLEQRGRGDVAERLRRPATPHDRRLQLEVQRSVASAKVDLSTHPDADVLISAGGDDLVVTVTRGEYESLIDGDMRQAAKLVRETLERSGATSLEAIYLTGGSSRTPVVSRMLREVTGVMPSTLDDPKLVVAEGALLVRPRPRRDAGARQPVGGAGAAPRGVPSNGTDPLPSAPAHGALVTPAGAAGPIPGTPVSPPARRRRSLAPFIAAAVLVVALAVAAAIVVPLLVRPGGQTAAANVFDVACWDGSTITSDQSCPRLEGEAALRWVFQIDDEGVCEATDLGAEAIVCRWDELPNSEFVFSRWDDSHAMDDHFAGEFSGDGQPSVFAGETIGIEWMTFGTGEPLPKWTCALTDVPFAFSFITTTDPGDDTSVAFHHFSPRMRVDYKDAVASTIGEHRPPSTP